MRSKRSGEAQFSCGRVEENAQGCSSSFAAPDVQEMFREGPNFAACLSCSGLATTLMDATTDKDPLVQEQIYNALCYLGESEPEEILHSCDEYLRQHDKVRPGGWGCWPCPRGARYLGGSGLG